MSFQDFNVIPRFQCHSKISISFQDFNVIPRFQYHFYFKIEYYCLFVLLIGVDVDIFLKITLFNIMNSNNRNYLFEILGMKKCELNRFMNRNVFDKHIRTEYVNSNNNNSETFDVVVSVKYTKLITKTKDVENSEIDTNVDPDLDLNLDVMDVDVDMDVDSDELSEHVKKVLCRIDSNTNAHTSKSDRHVFNDIMTLCVFTIILSYF
jgi:hypothetical protein